MSNLGLIISVFVTSLIVFVESQSQQKCSMSEECGKGCCYQSRCTTNKILCMLIKEKSKYERQCFVDQDCSSGCCIDFKCKTKWSYQCIDKNTCATNSDCDSDCCKDNKCQESSVSCFHFSLPTFNVEDILDKCSTSDDCYTSTKGCCVNEQCGACSRCKYISIEPIFILLLYAS
jgi:hypothetical protein